MEEPGPLVEKADMKCDSDTEEDMEFLGHGSLFHLASRMGQVDRTVNDLRGPSRRSVKAPAFAKSPVMRRNSEPEEDMEFLGHGSLFNLASQMGQVERTVDDIRRSSLLVSQLGNRRESVDSESSLYISDGELVDLRDELANVKGTWQDYNNNSNASADIHLEFKDSGKSASSAGVASSIASGPNDLDATSVSSTPSKLDIVRAKHDILRKSHVRRLSESRKSIQHAHSFDLGSITSRGSITDEKAAVSGSIQNRTAKVEDQTNNIPYQVIMSPSRTLETPTPVSPMEDQGCNFLELKVLKLERKLRESERKRKGLMAFIGLLLLLLLGLLTWPYFSTAGTTTPGPSAWVAGSAPYPSPIVETAPKVEQVAPASPVKAEQAKATSPLKQKQVKEAPTLEQERSKAASPLNKKQVKEALLLEQEQAKAASALKQKQVKEALLLEQEHARAASALKQKQVKEASTLEQERVKAAPPLNKNQVKEASALEQERAKAASVLNKKQVKEALLLEQEQAKAASALNKKQVKEALLLEQEQAKAASALNKKQVKEATLLEQEQAKAASPLNKNHVKEASPLEQEKVKVSSPVKPAPVKAATPIKSEQAKAATPTKSENAKATPEQGPATTPAVLASTQHTGSVEDTLLEDKPNPVARLWRTVRQDKDAAATNASGQREAVGQDKDAAATASSQREPMFGRLRNRKKDQVETALEGKSSTTESGEDKHADDKPHPLSRLWRTVRQDKDHAAATDNRKKSPIFGGFWNTKNDQVQGEPEQASTTRLGSSLHTESAEDQHHDTKPNPVVRLWRAVRQDKDAAATASTKKKPIFGGFLNMKNDNMGVWVNTSTSTSVNSLSSSQHTESAEDQQHHDDKLNPIVRLWRAVRQEEDAGTNKRPFFGGFLNMKNDDMGVWVKT